MASLDDRDVSARLDILEGRFRRERAVFGLVTGVAILVAALSWPKTAAFAQAQQRTDQILTVRGLVVVDERGVERVRLGAPLPDPIVGGKRMPRQGVVSGMLIFDAEGDERGGYVTEAHGDAMLTLDAKGRQQTIFIANRDGGANLSVWSGNNRNDNYVSVQAVPNPLIEIKQGGKTRVFSVAEPGN